jgi:hypothetical protein
VLLTGTDVETVLRADEILQRAKLSSESRASSSARKFRVDTGVSSHLSTSSTLEVSFQVYCFVANLD